MMMKTGQIFGGGVSQANVGAPWGHRSIAEVVSSGRMDTPMKPIGGVADYQQQRRVAASLDRARHWGNSLSGPLPRVDTFTDGNQLSPVPTVRATPLRTLFTDPETGFAGKVTDLVRRYSSDRWTTSSSIHVAPLVSDILADTPPVIAAGHLLRLIKRMPDQILELAIPDLMPGSGAITIVGYDSAGLNPRQHLARHLEDPKRATVFLESLGVPVDSPKIELLTELLTIWARSQNLTGPAVD
jgi:hypothetical protein